jgi:hypothetical protein
MALTDGIVQAGLTSRIAAITFNVSSTSSGGAPASGVSGAGMNGAADIMCTPRSRPSRMSRAIEARSWV